MCRWLTYRGPAIYMEDLLYAPDHSLIEQSLHAQESKVATNGDGFGVGWYGTRAEPGTYHEILPAWNDRNLRTLARHISTPMFFAHVRASTGTATSRANCHPFTHGRWLFMHNGQVGQYAVVRRALERLIPDDLYPQRQGTTDSEILFLLMLAGGLDDDPTGAARTMLGQVTTALDEAGVKAPFRVTAPFTNGGDLYVLRYSTDDKPPTLYYDERADSLTVVSEPLDETKGRWEEVPPSTILAARAGNAVELTPL